MTSEELAAAGFSPNKEEIHDSGNREDGEIRSEDKSGAEEDLADVDADPKELIAAKSAKSYPPSFVFSESKVTADLIKEYEAARFFPISDGHAPLDEQVPTPEANEVVVFRDFFTCGLRFPCDPILLAILDRFSIKIMKTFRCNFGTNVFAPLFELVIEKDIHKLDDGQYYEAHYARCTFNTRRQNSRNGLARIHLAPCCKTNFSED
jgi:hypothetical protein